MTTLFWIWVAAEIVVVILWLCRNHIIKEMDI